MSALPEWLAAAGAGAAAAGAAGASALGGGADGAAAASPAASSSSSTEPSATLSPTLTSTFVTLPAAGEGTSIVALSDSSVQMASSGLSVSPALTNSSMTGTESKSPMSGTFTSIVAMRVSRSDQRATHVGQRLADVVDEARAFGAVDDAVVVGQRQRQHLARDELLAVPQRFHGQLGQTQDGHFRRVDQRREVGATDAAEAGDREGAALHVGRAELAVARLL